MDVRVVSAKLKALGREFAMLWSWLPMNCRSGSREKFKKPSPKTYLLSSAVLILDFFQFDVLLFFQVIFVDLHLKFGCTGRIIPAGHVLSAILWLV